jgi:predicted nucleic acid-binding protein
MALYMLSTDVATCLIRGESRTLDARVASVAAEELCISAVTRGELLLGVSRQALQKSRDALKKGGEVAASSMDDSTLEALRKTAHNVLATLTPAEAKALRERFALTRSSVHTLETVGKEFEATLERLRSKAPVDSLSSVVDQFLTRAPCLPWDAAAATHFAAIAYDLHRIGTPMGTADTMIAGHAIAVGAVLVTGGEQGFLRVAGLKTENWTRRRPTQ